MTRRTYRLFALCACLLLLAGCAGPERVSRSSAAGKADGRILFAVNSGDAKTDGIYMLTNGSGTPRRVIGKESGDYALQYPRWSPDGQNIAYVRAQDRGSYSNVWIAGANGTAQRQLTDFRSKIAYGGNVDAQGQYVVQSSVVVGISWASNFMAFASDAPEPRQTKMKHEKMRLWFAEDTNVRPGDARTRVVPITADLGLSVDSTAISPDGRYVVFTAEWQAPNNPNKKTQVYILNLSTRQWKQLTEIPEGAYDPVWAPNSNYLAFVGRPAFRVNDIYVITRDGKNPQQITQTGAARAPVFSSDGRKLAFLNGAEGQFTLWTMDINPPADANSPLVYGKPEKVFDGLKYIDARSGLAWAA